MLDDVNRLRVTGYPSILSLTDEMNFFAVEPSAVHRLGPAALGPRPSDRRTHRHNNCPAGTDGANASQLYRRTESMRVSFTGALNQRPTAKDFNPSTRPIGSEMPGCVISVA